MTNDDGVHAPGIRALATRLAALGEVTVVAPIDEVSGISHALTVKSPLQYERLEEHVFAVDGTPADCVSLAVSNLLSQPPQLVVSGINSGANLADDVTYSGTVAGAMEGALLGLPAFAVSLASKAQQDYRVAAEFSAQLALLLARRALPPRTFLNVNVPPGEVKGIQITTQGSHEEQRRAALGAWRVKKVYNWLRTTKSRDHANGVSDIAAIRQSLISVTPLHVDLTNYAALEELSAWGISWNGGPPPERS